MIDEDQIVQLIREESVLIDRGAIGELYETGLKFLGIGVGGVLYTAGKKGGARGARMLRDKFGYQGNDLLRAAIVAFNQSNWGRAELLWHSDGLKIEVTNSTLASNVNGQKRPICHPIAGYIAGFLEEAWQKPVRVREAECMAQAQPHCLFVVE